MVKKGVFVALFAAIFVAAFALGVTFAPDVSVSEQQSSVLHYKAFVCTYKNGELIGCSHNLLYDTGKNITRDALGVGGFGAVLNISLCNATAGCAGPVVGATETFNTIVGCGLQSTQGTYAALTNAPGNWSVVKTFTATCDGTVMNSTRLTNATGSPFAGNTFTSVTLQTNDQLTINWTLMVS